MQYDDSPLQESFHRYCHLIAFGSARPVSDAVRREYFEQHRHDIIPIAPSTVLLVEPISGGVRVSEQM